ncbi:MAG TPA: arsenical efflux pump membrane protein ArsB [Gammaproteobacteria bacterium]|nr:arsenical efflux pump membrane protein ArsB [Gammaproteobacteria bacterium]
MIALAIFAATLVLVLLRPRYLGIGGAALLGAAAMIYTGVIPWQSLPALWNLVWDPTLTFLGLVVISLVLEQIGSFRWAALHMARRGGGSGPRLFLLLMLLGAAVAALLANDGAVLILTPIVLALLFELGLSPAATLVYIVAIGFVADTTSLPLITSNLTNILSARYFALPYDRYALVMVPVDLAALAATLAVLWLGFRRRVVRRYATGHLPAPDSAIRDPLAFKAGFLVLAIALAAYFLTSRLHIPISLITGVAALTLLGIGVRPTERKSAVSLKKVLHDTPWQIVAFSLGMYVVVFGLRNAGLVDYYSHAVQWLAGHGLFAATLGIGSLTALLSAAVNNLPAVLIGSLGIHQAPRLTPLIREAAVYANIVGSDLGPKLTPIGSLATLLWLHLLARRGESISWGRYLRWGFTFTPPILLATLTALAGWLWLIH